MNELNKRAEEAKEIVGNTKHKLVIIQGKLNTFNNTATPDKIELFSGQLEYTLEYLKMLADNLNTVADMLVESTKRNDLFYKDGTLAEQFAEIELKNETEIKLAEIKNNFKRFRKLWKMANEE